MGRNPHKRLLQRDTAEDQALVSQALHQVGIERFAERTFATLSGGEKQCTLVARRLPQQSPLPVLDEPTNHLDVRAQFELPDMIRSLRSPLWQRCTTLTSQPATAIGLSCSTPARWSQAGRR